MPWQGHDALDLRVPVDVVSSAATRQEPSVPFESAPDSSSGGVHACRYLHDRSAESQPARTSRQDAADLVSDRAQAKAMRICSKPRTLPAFDRIRIDEIDPEDLAVWFDERPGPRWFGRRSPWTASRTTRARACPERFIETAVIGLRCRRDFDQTSFVGTSPSSQGILRKSINPLSQMAQMRSLARVQPHPYSFTTIVMIH